MIYSVVKNCFKEPVCDAVIKLVEVVYDDGKEERRPIGHTFLGNTLSIIFNFIKIKKHMLLCFLKLKFIMCP